VTVVSRHFDFRGLCIAAVEDGPKPTCKAVDQCPLIAGKFHCCGTQSREARSAANTRGVNLLILNASTERDFDAVFANLIQLRAGGLVIAADPLFTAQLDATSALRVPCRRISHFRRSR
jgi:hypothetical protein